jgi:hypothetical protein
VRAWFLCFGVLAGCGGGAATTSVGAKTQSQHAVCDQYVKCVGDTTPAGLASVLAAYGKSGACWGSGDDDVCLDACRKGLSQTHAVFPMDAACPECLGNTDCAGASGGPACDTSAGRCVACTDNSTCSGATPVCATGASTCVECNAASDCGGGACVGHVCVQCDSDDDCSGTKRCDRSRHTCVACLHDGDCMTGVCISGGTCCQPESCAFVAKTVSIDPNAILCGQVASDRCPGAMIDCGTCSRGICTGGEWPQQCSLGGQPCTPATSGTCLPNELCTYSPTMGSYQCATDVRGQSCYYDQPCDDYRLVCDDYFDTSQKGTCHNYCQSGSECRSGESCKPPYLDATFSVCLTI